MYYDWYTAVYIVFWMSTISQEHERAATAAFNQSREQMERLAEAARAAERLRVEDKERLTAERNEFAIQLERARAETQQMRNERDAALREKAAAMEKENVCYHRIG